MTEIRNGGGKPSSVVVTWAALVSAIAIVLTIIGGSSAILNWLYIENNRLRAEITAVRIEFARTQVTRPEFKEVVTEITSRIEKRLDRIEKKLETAGGQRTD